VLREAGFVTARPEGARRIYRLEPVVLDQLQDQVDRYRTLWNQRLDALETEIARGKRERKEKKA
jgi:DNA-binding transcriptional ArsR family regulator